MSAGQRWCHRRGGGPQSGSQPRVPSPYVAWQQLLPGERGA
jgi:hypothetical protein